MVHLDDEAIKRAAEGRWPIIFRRLAPELVPALDAGQKKHVQCPLRRHEDRNPSFRIDKPEEGRAICSCGSYDAWNLLELLRGWSFPECLRQVADCLHLNNGKATNAKPVNGKASRSKATTGQEQDPLVRLAEIKRCPVESLRAYGARSNPAKCSVSFPMYRLGFSSGEPEKCSTNTMWPFSDNPDFVKGMNAKDKPSGMFLPHDKDGRVMYPEPGDRWVIVEGVKDASVLHSLGYNVVGLPGKSIKPESVPMFKGVDVVVCLDNDSAGQEATPEIVKRLQGTARSIKTVRLPSSGDVRDNIAAAGVEAVRGAIEAAGAIGQDEAPPEPPAFTKLLTCSEFLSLDLRPRFLVKNIMVANQPLVVGARSKSMKTSLAVDLFVSLGSGTPFLNTFEVPNPVRVALWSGESGAATIRETATRIAKSKGVDLADCSTLWSFDLPKLSYESHLDALRNIIIERELQAVGVDPLFLSLLTAETAGAAGNVYAMGSMLQPLSAIGQETGCTIVVLHHFRKTGQPDPDEPAALEELSQSGIAEWARQWILLQRRSPYQSDGRHELWMRAGGSAGHGGLWAVDIEEGILDPDTFTGRHWDVAVKTAGDTRQEVKRERENRKAQQAAEKEADHRRRVLVAMQDHPAGETERTIRIDAGLNPENFARAARQLVKEMRIEPLEIQKNNRAYPGFRLTGRATEQVEQVEQDGSVPSVPLENEWNGTGSI